MLIRSQPSPAAEDEPDRNDAEHMQTALRLWAASVPATGTLVETYLRSRGIVMPIPATLRFHGGTKHACGKFWPAMVALVTRGTDGTPAGNPPHLPCPRRRLQGAGRPAEDDARPVSRRCSAAWSDR